MGDGEIVYNALDSLGGSVHGDVFDIIAVYVTKMTWRGILEA